MYKKWKHAILIVCLVFGSLWSVQAQNRNSADGWVFYVKPDGTAAAVAPETYIHVGDAVGYQLRIESAISIPAEVTRQDFWIQLDPGIITEVNNHETYPVSTIDLSLSAAQGAAVTSISYPNTITGIMSVKGCINLTNFTISDAVTTIANDAFNGNSSLVSIIIPATVTSMGNNVFYNCTSLQSATVLNSTVGSSQFQNCTALKDLTLSDNVTTIGGKAFQNCSSLETLTVPTSVTTIGGNAFSGLTGLKTLNFYAKNVSGSLFNGLPIENLDLTGAQSIDASAFSGCSKLKTVVMSNSMTSIGNDVFYNCTALTDVTVAWATPLSVPPITFSGVNTQAATLHVPAGTKALYQAAPVWKDFFNIVEDTPTAIKTVDNASFHACFINNALRIESPQAELINIYSITGSLLYAGKKNEGVVEIPFTSTQGVYIIKGSVSGTIKVVK